MMIASIFRPALLIAALTGLAACSPASDPAADPAPVASVVAADAWCRPSPNGAKAGGCYVTLTAATDDRLTGGSTPQAGLLQVHEMKTENGMMTMGEMAQGLPLPAGEAVTLAPGGAHLMLMDLAAPMVAGETVPLTLNFADAAPVTVQAKVRYPTMAGMDHGAH